MKKSFIALGLLCLMAGLSTQASCLEMYKEKNLAPSDNAVKTAAVLSTTGVTVGYVGLELASATYAAGAALLADSDNIIIDLIALDIMQDGITSSTEAVYHGSSSTLAATGIIDGSRKNYKSQIKLIQEARVAQSVTGTTLAEFVGDLNDRRPVSKKLSVSEVAEEISVADARGEFCMDAEDMMTMSEIRHYIDAQF